jgi:hypothetical protein
MARKELQLSPQEKRLLHRFFHRNALPYAAPADLSAALGRLYNLEVRLTPFSPAG